MQKNFEGPPLTAFGIVRFFKGNKFRLETLFSQVQHSLSGFFSEDRCFSNATFLKFVFIGVPSQFLQETKRFANVEDSSRFSALCDLPETFIKEFRNKKFGKE